MPQHFARRLEAGEFVSTVGRTTSQCAGIRRESSNRSDEGCVVPHVVLGLGGSHESIKKAGAQKMSFPVGMMRQSRSRLASGRSAPVLLATLAASAYVVLHSRARSPRRIVAADVIVLNVLDANATLANFPAGQVLDINAVIYGLIYLFYEPNPEDPLNHEAAELYRENISQFERTVKRTLAGTVMQGETFQRLV